MMFEKIGRFEANVVVEVLVDQSDSAVELIRHESWKYYEGSTRTGARATTRVLDHLPLEAIHPGPATPGRMESGEAADVWMVQFSSGSYVTAEDQRLSWGSE